MFQRLATKKKTEIYIRKTHSPPDKHAEQAKLAAIHHLVNPPLFVSRAMYRDADDKISKQVIASFCLLISRTADDCKHATIIGNTEA